MPRRKRGAPWPWDVPPIRRPPVRPEGINTFHRLARWMRGAFGLEADELPAALRIDQVLPVVEQRWPEPKEVVIPPPGVGVLNPAFTVTVPADEIWTIQSLRFSMITAVGGANREPVLDIYGVGGFPFAPLFYEAGPGGYSQAANTPATYSAAPLGVMGDSGAILDIPLIPLPMDFWLMPGWVIHLRITPVFAGDQVTNPALSVRWLPV